MKTFFSTAAVFIASMLIINPGVASEFRPVEQGEEITLRPGATFKVPNTAELDQFITAALEKTQLPGLAIAILGNGKPIYIKGFGVKRFGSEDPIDVDTLFAIGSLTKPLTTLLMSILIDQEKFEWDTRVKDIYPTFTLADKELEKTLTLRLMVSHCSGFTPRDLASYFSSEQKGAEKLFHTLSLMKPEHNQGEQEHHYNNQIFAAAGYIAACLGSAPSYEKYWSMMKNEIFCPLEMNNSTASTHQALQSDNIAFDHELVDGKHHPTKSLNVEGLEEHAPAGSVFSSVKDLAKLMQMELSNGRFNGSQFVSEKTYSTAEPLKLLWGNLLTVLVGNFLGTRNLVQFFTVEPMPTMNHIFH